MSDRASVSSELQAKREYLAQIRRRKEGRRKAQAAATRGEESAPRTAAAPPPVAAAAPAQRQDELGDYIDRLLEAPVPGATTADSTQRIDPRICAKIAEEERARCRERWALSLDIASQGVPSKMPETYERGVQVDPVDGEKHTEEEEEAVDEEDAASTTHPQERASGDDDDQQGTASKETQARSLTAEEVEELLQEPEFRHALHRSARRMERSLERAGAFDELIDYTADNDNDVDLQQESLSALGFFWDASVGRGRAVAAMDWNPVYKELFLASYIRSPTGVHGTVHGASLGGVGSLLTDTGEVVSSEGSFLADSQAASHTMAERSPFDRSIASDAEGVVAIWNTEARKDPELVFVADEPVVSAIFHPFSPRVVVGGTYGGRILVWDMRAKAEPVRQSSFSPKGHSHPVYAMRFVGTGNAHSLVSASTDGTVCTWSLDDLREARTSSLLRYAPEGGARKHDIAVSCMSVGAGDASTVYLGGEDGGIFTATLAGENSTIDHRREAHFGPIASLHHHPHHADLSTVLLSASMDWTARVWNTSSADAPLATLDGFGEYVADCQWSPHNPALIASGDGGGTVALWRLSADMSVPVAATSRATCGALAGTADAATELPPADAPVTALRWAPDGRHVVAADAAGVLSLFHVGADIANPSAADRCWLPDALSKGTARNSSASLA